MTAEGATVENPTVVNNLVIPEDTGRSRLARAADKATTAEHLIADDKDADDIVTANDRLKSFWAQRGLEDVEITPNHTRHVLEGGVIEWKAKVTVSFVKDDKTRSATGSASRRSDDWNEIVRSRPLDSAETAALSRALRFLGIKLT